MKQPTISFKSTTGEGLKAKTYVSCYDGNIRIIQRAFMTKPNANEEILRKVGNFYFVQTEIAFKPDSWIFINQIVDYLLYSAVKKNTLEQLTDFSSIINISIEELTNDRKAQHVDYRDMFIALTVEKPSDITPVLSVLGLKRPSYYASKERFKVRCETYPEYLELFNTIKSKTCFTT